MTRRPDFPALLLLIALLAACGSEATPGAALSPTAAVSPEPSATAAPRSPASPALTIPPIHPSVDGYGGAVVEVDGNRLAVLVADTPDERRHGLMEVPDLPDDVGMLFVFGEDRRGGFWMKDTLIPLSIAFIAADGSIVDILDMEPCPSGDDCPSYVPDTEYRYALEVERGWFEARGIEEGETVDLPPVDRASSS